MPVKSNIEIENARIGSRNFAGAASQYNAEGNRNFLVYLDPEIGKVLADAGWNVKIKLPKDAEDDPRVFMQVTANFGQYPPRIVLISSKGRAIIEEDKIDMLDWVDISKVDLVIRPYNWTMYKGTAKENHGVKAYLKSMYITVSEDKFEEKYADIQEISLKDVTFD